MKEGAKDCHSMSMEKLILRPHSQSPSHRKLPNQEIAQNVDVQQGHQRTSGESGSPSLSQSKSEIDKNICLHRDHFDHSQLQPEIRNYVPGTSEDAEKSSNSQLQSYNGSKQKINQTTPIIGKGIKSPLPTNNLPPHKQNKLYKRHMAASSTPPLYSRNNNDPVVVVRPNSHRKCSNSSSPPGYSSLGFNDGEQIDCANESRLDKEPVQELEKESDSTQRKTYDSRAQLLSSNLANSGAPPQFWADSSCHEDDPPSQMSGRNTNLSVASSTSGVIVDQNDTPPPVPPHGRTNITSPPIPFNSRAGLIQMSNPSFKSNTRMMGERREDEDASSPDYTSLSTSSVDHIRQQIPNPPPPPKLYYHMRANELTRHPPSYSNRSYKHAADRGMGEPSKQLQAHDLQPQQYYDRSHQREYHHAKDFVTGPFSQEMRHAPTEGESQRSVQSQIGGGIWQHPQQAMSAYKGVKHNSERYLIQATDGSKVNIQQPVSNNQARRRQFNNQGTSHRSRNMMGNNDV